MTENVKKRNERLFLAAYVLWLISAVLSFTLWQKYDIVDSLCDNFKKLGYLLLVCKFLLKNKYTKKDVIAVFIIIYVCAITAFAKYNNQLIPVVLFVCSSGDIRKDRIFKWTLGVQMVIMMITVIGSQTGLIEDIIWYEGTERIRHSLGYDYCGYPAHFLLFMSLMWMCIRKKAFVLDSIIMLCLNYVMYVYTDSRTDFYLAVLGIIGFFVWDKMNTRNIFFRARKIMVCWGFHIACVLSILLHWIYDSQNTIMFRMNGILNGRLQLGHDAIVKYGFSLFGEQIRWFGQGSLKDDPTRIYNYVDCSFLKEGLTFGVLFLVLLAVGFYFAGKKIVEEKDTAVSWAMLVSLVYSVINAHLCVLTFNVFILLLGSFFSDIHLSEGKATQQERVKCFECI